MLFIINIDFVTGEILKNIFKNEYINFIIDMNASNHSICMSNLIKAQLLDVIFSSKEIRTTLSVKK